MKKSIILIAAIILALPVLAQREERNEDPREMQTIFGNQRISHGGYGSFGAGYSMIDDKHGAVMTGRAAWIIGHSLALGFAGTGFVNEYNYNAVLDKHVNLTGGYGGFLFEPIILPKFPVHLSFPVIAGVGGIAYTSNLSDDPYMNPSPWVEDTDTYLIFEPGAEIEMNVLRFFRIGFGMSYRMTTEIDLLNSLPVVLDCISVGMSFKFGKF